MAPESCGVVPTDTDPRIQEYWDWLAVALFLLLTVDMLTTVAAAHAVGVDGESNPIMAWALGEGLVVVVAVNLLALVGTAVLFAGVTDRLSTTPSPADRYTGLLVELWLGGLIAVGLAVFANNLTVIVLGESLL